MLHNIEDSMCFLFDFVVHDNVLSLCRLETHRLLLLDLMLLKLAATILHAVTGHTIVFKTVNLLCHMMKIICLVMRWK